MQQLLDCLAITRQWRARLPAEEHRVRAEMRVALSRHALRGSLREHLQHELEVETTSEALSELRLRLKQLRSQTPGSDLADEVDELRAKLSSTHRRMELLRDLLGRVESTRTR